ncbi:MAG: ABC transporter permease [Saprospiraceae bacterium]
MLLNNLKIGYRQLINNKVYSIINLLGLSFGIAVAIFVFTFVNNELSYDNWMEDSERTYRLHRHWSAESNTVWTPSLLAQKLSTDFPEVDVATGFAPGGEELIEHQGKKLYVENTASVDSTFFQVLTIPFLHGSPAIALNKPNSMVISKELSENLFGTSNSVGQVVQFQGDQDYTISGVFDLEGKNTHIVSDIFTRFQWYSSSWTGNNRATYARLKPNISIPNLEEKLTESISALMSAEFLSINYTPTSEDFAEWKFQPLNEVHLQSANINFLASSGGSMRSIYIFILIGILVLGVAIINYINLATARASQRAKEVGIKKVMGEGRLGLTIQFITEALLQSFLAAALAIIIAMLLMPFFNNIIDRELILFDAHSLGLVISILGVALCTGLLAGIYPALVISAFSPSTAIKSNYLNQGGKGLFRKILVTGQFSVTIILLIVMAFIYRQVNFMTDHELGFHADQVIIIPINTDETTRKIVNMKSRFENIPGVSSVTTASRFPGHFIPDWGMLIEGRPESVSPNVIFSDPDYIKTLNIEMKEGRFLSSSISADTIDNYVVNEEFINLNNIKNPTEARIKFTSDDSYGRIVGVMKNFHFKGLSKTIRPLIIGGYPRRSYYVGIKLSTTDISASIASIRKLWSQVEPQHPMRFSFLDEDFAAQYAEQNRMGTTLMYATILTLFISLMGLFGFTVFNVERRAREIGIRKVLGASITEIMGMLSFDFLKLSGLALVIAVPIGYYISSIWMEDFAYRTDLAWWVFALCGLITVVVGLLTVGLQSMKTALVNPVESLRSE